MWMELESDLGVEDMSLMGRTVTRKEDNGRGCGRRADMRLKVRDGSQGWNEMGILMARGAGKGRVHAVPPACVLAWFPAPAGGIAGGKGTSRVSRTNRLETPLIQQIQ